MNSQGAQSSSLNQHAHLNQTDVLIKTSVLRNFSTLLSEYQLSSDCLARFNANGHLKLDEAESYMSQPHYMKLLQLAALETGDPLFPLKLGLRTAMSDLGAMGMMAAKKPTLGVALRSLVKHFDSYQQGANVAIDQAGDDLVRLTYHVGERPSAAVEADIDFTLGVTLRLLRDVAGPQWRPREVHLTYGPVDHKATYERFVGGPIWFLQDGNGIVCEPSVLSLPMPQADPEVSRALEAYLVKLEQGTQLKDDLIHRLRVYIVSNMGPGDILIADAARSCGLSQRTLQRRLAERDEVFEHLVGETRRDVAERLLAATSLSAADIGLRCGYSDPTNFHRAFVRWTGVTPGQFRRDAQAAINAPVQPQTLQSQPQVVP